MELREIGWEGVGWMQQAQDRAQCQILVYAVMNVCVL